MGDLTTINLPPDPRTPNLRGIGDFIFRILEGRKAEKQLRERMLLEDELIRNRQLEAEKRAVEREKVINEREASEGFFQNLRERLEEAAIYRRGVEREEEINAREKREEEERNLRELQEELAGEQRGVEAARKSTEMMQEREAWLREPSAEKRAAIAMLEGRGLPTDEKNINKATLVAREQAQADSLVMQQLGEMSETGVFAGWRNNIFGTIGRNALTLTEDIMFNEGLSANKAAVKAMERAIVDYIDNVIPTAYNQHPALLVSYLDAQDVREDDIVWILSQVAPPGTNVPNFVRRVLHPQVLPSQGYR